MRGFIDLHSHWVAGVDDGAKTHADGGALLKALWQAGFDYVVATPHMRPGMFDNERPGLTLAFGETARAVGASETTAHGGLPRVGLASEHFFDDVVFERLVTGQGLPYPGGKSALVEFAVARLPARVEHRLIDLKRKGLIPVIAHPERYEQVWKDPAIAEPLVDAGGLLLLDVAALAGKYGRAPRKAAEALLDRGLYFAACSDAHKARDVEDVTQGIEELEQSVGEEEARFLLVDGPSQILSGKIEG